MLEFYNSLIIEKTRMRFENFEKMMKNIYLFLIELDQFKKEYYHKIFYYTFLLKKKKNQNSIAMILGMDQSTVSRKLKEIENYILLKIKM